MLFLQSFTIEGMTCGRCVASVTEVISALEPVTGVEVDLTDQLATVGSNFPVDQAAVAAAVASVGFEVAA